MSEDQKSIGWGSSQSFYSVENVNGEDRLKIDYALPSMDDTRKQLILRRATTIIFQEEKRLYAMTNAQAIAELDALKAQQDATHFAPVKSD